MLEPGGRALVAKLAARPWAPRFYLAGSAALAAYLGHRRVRDLDLMSRDRRLLSPERRDLMDDLAMVDSGVRVETARDGFLYVRLESGAAIRFYYYPYPSLESGGTLHGMPLASPLDLALMKLGAVISRGAKRDFLDLYLLSQHLPLAAVLERSAEKFPRVRDFPLQALKGLTDLTQTIGEPLPALEIPVRWQDVEAWLAGEARRCARQHLGLGPEA